MLMSENVVRIYDMKQKEVINIKDGCRLGYVCDIIVDIDDGKLVKIIVPGPGRMFGVFGAEAEYHVPWCDVKQVGDDIILVDVESDKILVDCD